MKTSLTEGLVRELSQMREDRSAGVTKPHLEQMDKLSRRWSEEVTKVISLLQKATHGFQKDVSIAKSGKMDEAEADILLQDMEDAIDVLVRAHQGFTRDLQTPGGWG